MLKNIERTFNAIWGVEQGRRGLSSFLLYWAVLSIGPIFLGAGLIMSTYLLSLKIVVGDVNLLSAVAPMLRFVPVAMTTVAFTLLFAAVPNCRVPIKDALVGGVVTAVCFELAKTAFGAFVANSSFQLIYGAFAVVPIFLLWVNFLWMIILLGAVFVRTLAEKEYAGGAKSLPDMLAVLVCLEVFRQHSKTGFEVTDKDCIRAGVGLVHWQRLRSLLVNNHWITVTEAGDYVLSRDLKGLSLWDVAKLVGLPAGSQLSVSADTRPWLKYVSDIQAELNDKSEAKMSVDLDSLYSESLEDDSKAVISRKTC